MDIFTLTDTFLADDVVDEFVSAIWTERYTTSGEVQIVLPVTKKNLTMLQEDTYLALRGSKEVMVIDTQQIENGLLTVTGKTLDLAALNQRFLWSYNPASSAADQRITDYVDGTKKPGEFISSLVTKWAIAPGGFPSAWTEANLDWPNEVIPNLTLGEIDHSGEVQLLSGKVGPLYEAVATLANQFQVGISLYLESADAVAGYSLKFKTYKGKDRTSGQTAYPLVRLVPELDGLSDIKEIRSSAKLKNVVYVYYQGKISKHLADPSMPDPEGLARRVLLADAAGNPTATGTRSYGIVRDDWRYGNYSTAPYVTAADVAAFREQTAKDALANNNYIRAIDGQTSPISDYKFGADYELGDIIELEGLTGTIAKARITEYIRTQDRNGERAYPTIAVET